MRSIQVKNIKDMAETLSFTKIVNNLDDQNIFIAELRGNALIVYKSHHKVCEVVCKYSK